MKKTVFKSGDWNAICDVCGRKYKASKLLDRWDGLRVCKSHYEERHIADFFRGRPDDQSVEWTRPEPNDVYVSQGLYIDFDYYEDDYMGDT